MNPYYVITFEDQMIEGPVSWGGGRNPKWNNFDTINHHMYLDTSDNKPSGLVEITFKSDGEEISRFIIDIWKLNSKKYEWYDTFRGKHKSGKFYMQCIKHGFTLLDDKIKNTEEYQADKKLWKRSATEITEHKQYYKDLQKDGLHDGCSDRIIQITIIEAQFLHDKADLFGKQDPFVQIRFGGEIYRTRTVDEAGLLAKFNQDFFFDNVVQHIQNGGLDSFLLFEAYDDDNVRAEPLGWAQPFSMAKILKRASDMANKHGEESRSTTEILELKDAKGEKTGDLLINFQLVDHDAMACC